MRQTIRFEESRAKKYRKRLEVLAFKTDDPILFHKTWGDQQLRSKGWVIVSLSDKGEATGDIYGCDASAFETTYEPASEENPNLYRKSEHIRAYQPGYAFEVDTVLADGFVEVEGAFSDDPDAWIVQAPKGEVYVIPDAQFQQLYVEVEGYV